ncbi:type VI secretion system tube protein Hcp [Enterobacter sp. MF024]|uniref:Hcp family type VI secretion system effector n=1 Tax=Enterobacter sp. MF024 TaxID=2555644 RepID=UPI001106C8A0|nr:type VI secretion system tube protein TssD [Enterobacter sp. MF024]TLU69469.1 type VI secretion system tube protein Hcp [Enterobacter sp. MF024]
MSLPAYLFLYDENGMLLNGGSLALGREGAIEVMSSSYGVSQPVDTHTGRMTGTRQHAPYIIHKQVNKLSPYLAICICVGRRLQKAEIKYYEINAAGIEREIYRVTLEGVVIMSVNANHTYIPGTNSHNMIETVSLCYNSIEWYYLDGVIKYADAWTKPAPQQQKAGE